VRARVRITSRYLWPSQVDGSTRARTGREQVTVSTVLQLCAEEGHVLVTTSFVNPSRDHRLRVHLPLPRPAQVSEAESAFAVVTRPLVAEGRPDEFGLPTYASHRFVSAGGLSVAHVGLCEYELVDVADGPEGTRARTLALTLLRATGMLSRLGMAYRPLPAGPITPVEGLQMVGRRIECRYALAVDHPDPFALADDAFLPVDVVHAPGGGTRPPEGSLFSVEGAEVSAVRRSAGMLEVRVFNPRPTATTVRLGERSGWLVDLRGRAVGPVDGSFELRPFGIATVHLPDG
jgi:mannosylglycerate hydrolase